ncbi:hypothetical protein TNCV_2038351 [Trichonephila clavipes]|nr:hypothetical protein TNCV_2038351 [Trichonephila clavipes]
MSDHKFVSGWQRCLPLVAPFRTTIPRFDAPLSSRRERSARSSGQKQRRISVTGFNRIDNIVSLINSETWSKMPSKSSCPGLPI